MRLYPLKFRPIFKERIWGGQKLRDFGKDIPSDEKIGESWELADLPNEKSVIANGELAGQTLSSAIKKYPKEITGDENFSGTFPLLIKFLDAQDILSVQVHPDRQTCERLGKGEPKTECWYIIAAEPGAVIYKGLKKGVTKDKFAEAIQKGSVAELLTEVAVEAGQCYFLPAGTAHSIGAGLLIAEIQTPSDTTYRVFDWNRVDDAGKARQLHIEEALESIHFDAGDDEPTVTTMGRLVDCEYFKIDKGHETEECELLLSAGQMRILIILTGSGKSTDGDGSCVEFRAGDCLLVPAAYEGAIQFDADTQYLTVSI
ncbi:MAG TPA: type I phosphomannose isomerase catalytic subunit [Sedimentisphaerales bacterium]|nr:type I phosphomannose isomerase catalytic subunit [Sedimentisphaerales bacterium]